jgi:hypothetical protein
MKKYWIFCLLLGLIAHSAIIPSYAQPDSRLTSGVDVGAGWKGKAWIVSGLYHEYLKIDPRGLFQVGWGLRATHLRGNDLDFITAPAHLTKGKSGFSSFNAPTLLRQIDTLQMKAAITSFNFNLSLQLSIFKGLDVGANADILGIAFGTRRAGYYLGSKGYSKTDSLNLHQTYQQARPASASIQLLGDNTVGNLNTELYARLHIIPRVGVKVSYLFTTNEYITSQPLVDDNRRFRFRSPMIFVGLNFPIEY